ncbi:MAG: MOSC N-terminal beta barrel domain-containing protein [Actinomycetes bacterium]
MTQAELRVVGRLEQVWIYPVKSLAGTPLTTVPVDLAGPRGDRAHSVVDAGSGEPVRAKHAPVLASLAPSGDPAADERAIATALGRAVRLAPSPGGSAADVAAVHLVSRQALDRAAAGEVPQGCSAEDPRANLLLSLPDDDERTWVGRLLSVGDVVLEVTRTPKHCLGVYAEVRSPGVVTVGDPVRL